MADIVTGTVTGQVDVSQLLMGQADIRREQESIGSDIRRDTAAEAGAVVDAVKTSGWANSDRTGSEADRIVAQDTAYFIAGQSQNFSNATALAALTASTNSNFNQTLAAIQLAGQQSSAAAALEGAKNAAATALEGAKVAAAVALGQSLMGQQIVQDGMLTRALINSQTIDELRFRNLEHRDHGHHGHEGCKEGVFSFGPPLGATYPT
jgi:hypothetical protein